MRKMLQFVVVSVLFFALSPVQAAAQDDGFWHKLGRTIRGSVPQVTINSPVPLGRGRRDKTSFPRQQRVSPSASGTSQEPSTSATVSNSSQENSSTRRASTDQEGVVVVAPNGARGELPDFRGRVIAVQFQSNRDFGLEGEIQREFAARGAGFIKAPSGFSGDICAAKKRPIVCVIVLDSVFNGDGNDNNSSASYGGRSSSGGSSWEGYWLYHVTVVVELWFNDGSSPQLLGGWSETFTVPRYAGQSSSSSGGGGRGGYSASSSSQVNYSQDRDRASRSRIGPAALKAVRHLLKKKDGWQPGAAELVRDAR